MSDLHGKILEVQIPKCDVLVVAGDLSMNGNAWWFLNFFVPVIKSRKSQFDKCIVVFGNHDDKIELGDIYKEGIPDYIEILFGTGIKYKGKKFFGNPYCKSSPEIIDSLFNREEEVLKGIYNEIPEDTDVLITHQPPYGYGDTVKNQSYHLGSESLMDRIRVVKPKVHIFGHIHTGKKYEENNGTKFYNVSVLDEYYNVAYKPTIINLGL